MKQTAIEQPVPNTIGREALESIARQASSAFPIYRKVPAKQKSFFLDTIAGMLEESRNTLVSLTGGETGLPAARLQGELTRTTTQINQFAAYIRDDAWKKTIVDGALRQEQLPLGPVAVFGAGNFPYAFSVAGNDTISALAAGCPVIYKSHPGHPLTSEWIGGVMERAILQTGMPEGMFTMLPDSSIDSGRQLVAHPLIKAVGFTGSLKAGRALFDVAMKRRHPIPVYAEMGSVNPVFVLPGILREKGNEVAEKLSASNLLNAGQFCTNPGLIITLRSAESEAFLAHFAKQVKMASAETMLSEAICQGYETAVRQLVIGGADLHACGMEGTGNRQGIPYLFHTDGHTFLHQSLLQEEVFGPCSLHVVADGKDELLEIAATLEGQLTASVWGSEEDMNLVNELLPLLETRAGRIIYNQPPTGVELSPAMVHGGPYPAATDSKFSSVGVGAMGRWTRPVCYQNWGQ